MSRTLRRLLAATALAGLAAVPAAAHPICQDVVVPGPVIRVCVPPF